MDKRPSAYSDLHASMVDDSRILRGSSRRTLSFLSSQVPFQTVLDIGCGVGIWLVEALAMGCDITGVDGPWLDRTKLLVPGDQVVQRDLESEIDLVRDTGRRFDLVISLEVAEHLSPAAAPTFVKSLVTHGDMILFSAAVPEQGGAHHVNEQWPAYWQNLFAAHGYACIDLLRANLWDDEQIGTWYRQNMLLYVSSAVLERHPILQRWKVEGAVPALIHPGIFVPTRKRLQEYQAVIDFLAAGGDFRVGYDERGQMTFARLPRRPE